MKYLSIFLVMLAIAPLSCAAYNNNVLVLQPVIAEVPMEDFIEAYQEGEYYFLPLETLARILGFPIEVDVVSGTASGSLIDATQQFSLDIAKHQVKIGKQYFTFTDAEVQVVDTDIFVDSTQLAKWWTLDMTVSLRMMTLVVTSMEMLPFQKKLARSQYHETLAAQKKQIENKHYPRGGQPYKAVDWPFLDATIGQEYRNKGNIRAVSSYAVQSAGDLGYMSTSVFATGSSGQDALHTLRIRGERKDVDGRLLGGLHATEYAIGDINAAAMSLISQGGLGRGVRISNRPLGQAAEFDHTDFIGDAQPGWEIELYRNGTLLDFQLVGDNGRYQFLSVPVLFGNNIFRLVFYGPEGQMDEEVKQIFADNAVLKKGEALYEVSLDEKANNVFGLQRNQQRNDADGIRAVGGMEYGVGDKLSLRFGSMATPLKDGIHDYFTTGLRTGKGRFLGSADVAYDTTAQGWAAKMTALTSVSDLNLKLEQRFYDHFISEERNPLGVLARRQSELNINSYYRLPLIQEMNIGGNILYETLNNGLEQTTISNRLSKSILGIAVTNSLGAVFVGDERLEGNIALRGRVGSVLWGGMTYYRLSPQKTIDSISLSAQKNLSRNLYARLGFIKEMGVDQHNLSSVAFTWDLHRFRVSTQLEQDDNGTMFIGTSLNISFGNIPGRRRLHMQSDAMAYSGAVTAEAFLDSNYNKIWDVGEEALDNPSFKVDGRDIKAMDGLAYETQLMVDRTVNVEFNSDGLTDPLWKPGLDGMAVVPRPGSVAVLQFPVFATSEIEGTIYILERDGRHIPLKHSNVQLLDSHGKSVKTAKTEYDGFYLFDNLLPGEYTLMVAENSLAKYGVKQLEKEVVKVSRQSDVFSGRDIQLVR